MHSDNSRYSDYPERSANGAVRRGNPGRAASEGQPLEHELYPDVTARQNPYDAPHQDQGQYRQYAAGYGQRQATTRQPARGQALRGAPQRGATGNSGVTRQTAADLGQVDNSQVAGRVAYDEDGNLVVVKKEEKKAPVQVAAIVGSALSAVTSALFSSHIGIGGSLLTVAIGAAVSAAGTQLYTHLISKSTDKLKSAIDNGPGSQQLVGVMDSSQLGEGGFGYGAEQTVADYESEEGTPTADGGRIAPQGMIDAASAEHDRQVRRRGIIIVAVAALAAVVVAAGVVTWATQGNGIGAKTPSIVNSATNATNANENSSAANAATAPEAPATTTAANAGQDAASPAATPSNANAGGAPSSAADQATGPSTSGTASGDSGSSASGTGTTSGTTSSTTANAAGSGSGTSAGTSASDGSGSTAGDSGTASGGANASGSSSAANASGTGSSTGGTTTTGAQAGTAE